jgi:hypothetical protein
LHVSQPLHELLLRDLLILPHGPGRRSIEMILADKVRYHLLDIILV